jgi:hypothetical protein
MQIGAAHAASADLQQDVARFERRLWNVFDAERALGDISGSK